MVIGAEHCHLDTAFDQPKGAVETKALSTRTPVLPSEAQSCSQLNTSAVNDFIAINKFPEAISSDRALA